MTKTLNKNILFFSTLAGSLLSQSAFAQETPQILSDSQIAAKNFLPDFSYAGYGFGKAPIPEIETVIDVADHGAIPDDGKDDSEALQSALASAHKSTGPVRVQLAAGQYILSEILWIEKSGIVLAGMGNGKGGTRLYMPRPLGQIDDGGALKEVREYLVELDKRERQPDANIDVIFSEYSWSGGFIWTRVPGGRHATYLERYDRPIAKITDISMGKQGTKALTVADTSGFVVGDVLQIHWHNRAGPNGPLVKSLYGETELKIGNRHWSMPDRPLVRQATRIEAIDGDRVTIADPLLHDIEAEMPAYFAKWEHLTNVGLQDFAMVFPENPYFGHHVEAGFNGIYFTGVHNGWIKNIRVTNADSGILTDDLANVTIANIVTDGNHKAHYSVHVGNVHNVLIDSLTVFNPTQHTLSFNTQATKSVYKDAVVWTRPSLDQHAGANHQNLYDNVTVHLTPDQIAKDGAPMFDLYEAGGAGYWQPGHGRYNTNWNLKILVDGGVETDQELVILGATEGPDARVIGLHGNRPIRLDYRPEPYVESLNRRVDKIPSLYTYQLEQRKK
ncbi:glycosyl hydrolase family 28-related protein [Parasphingorhabdus cellanae]|uniref:Rhamnogalacturonase A/B/Epimerase-like pectate lyase domain-containing protein n=1 Tax=Parasphingorhabdus cellanae TaxID=2806553 RepID=A0ABX7TAB4_9SPHN|nr:glycosyl hydrolase family 28-related protein [Parasphingorhabdus cellanae]QTD57632.1 hypothetical protein J4G78_09010 [Parasphingorhabdus cellanae]